MIPSNYFPLEFFRHKVRVRLLDAATGHPLTGVAVTLTAEVSDGEPKLSVPLNTLVTDHVGYVAFSLARFGSFTPEIETLNPRAAGFDTDRVSALRLDAPAVGLRGHDLLASLFSGNMALGGPGPLADLTVIGSQWAANRVAQLGLKPADRPLVNHFDSAFVVKASRSAALADCECHTRVKGLRSVEEADDIDRLVSPGSFFAQDPVLVGEGGCQVATATATPPRDVRLFQVVVDAPANPDLAGANRPLSMADKGAAPQGPRWATAQRFLQRWTPLGYSLGDIRYSLPLAPGESVNLAVIEWSREDRITRRDAAFSQEGLQHRQKRNRDIEEAVTAMLSEDQGGGSFMAGLSGAANATVPVSGVPVNLAAGTAIGGGVTHSWGQRDISADTAQNLRDKLSQTSESLRSLNSTTVIVANQSERNELSTRTVANHNRCHALTIQYFEVLRNYRVELFRLPDLRALLVPFTPISFDAQAALRWEHLLRPALLNTALAEGFDALRLRLYGAALLDKPGGSGAGSGGGTGGGAGGTAGGTGAGGANQGPTPFTGSSKRSLSPVKNLESSNFDNTNLYIAANSLVQVKEDADSGWVSYGPTIDYGAGGSTPVPAAEAALWKDAGSPKYSLVAKIGNRTYPVGASRTFTAMDSGMLEFFVNDQIGSYNDNWAIRRNGEIFPAGTIYGLRYTVTVMAPNQPTAPVVPEVPLPTLLQDTDPSPRAVADYRAEALLAHLASQSVHYNRVVWMSMDRADLELLLDAADTGRKQLFDGVDARPVAIWRNHLAFIAPGSGIAEEGRSSRPLSSQIVALPSRGVLAEAQLGSCVACEERDASRVQEWTLRADDRAPRLDQLVPGPKGTAPLPGQVQTGTPVLSIQAGPVAPDPGGMAAVLGAIVKGDAFRNMSAQADVNDLLEKLAEGSFASLPDAQAAAKKAKEKKEAAEKSAAADAEREANARVSNGVSASELADRFSLLPQIKNFARDLGLSEEATRQFAVDTLHGNRPTSGTAVPGSRGAVSNPTRVGADEVQIAIRVIDAWDRPAEADIQCTVTDDVLGPQGLLSTNTRPSGSSGYGRNGLLQPIKGLSRGLLDLHVQIMEADYQLMSSEVRDLYADSVAYRFDPAKRFYRFQVTQGHDERRISVASGETLVSKATRELGAQGMAGGKVRKVLQLSLTLQGSRNWEDEIARTQTSTTEYTLRVPNSRLVVTQL